MEHVNKDGAQFCRLGVWLAVVCAAMGVAIALFGEGITSLGGYVMAVGGGWGSFAFYWILAEPTGVTGWKRYIVVPAFERSVRRDFLAHGPKDSFSTLHAAKRFTVFCFFGGLTLGFFGMQALLPSFTVGLGMAFLYDWFVRRKEDRVSKKK